MHASAAGIRPWHSQTCETIPSSSGSAASTIRDIQPPIHSYVVHIKCSIVSMWVFLCVCLICCCFSFPSHCTFMFPCVGNIMSFFLFLLYLNYIAKSCSDWAQSAFFRLWSALFCFFLHSFPYISEKGPFFRRAVFSLRIEYILTLALKAVLYLDKWKPFAPFTEKGALKGITLLLSGVITKNL